MVVVSHLFFFLWKKLVRGAAHMSRPSHYLELSISRQPHLLFLIIKLSKIMAYLLPIHVSWNSIFIWNLRTSLNQRKGISEEIIGKVGTVFGNPVYRDGFFFIADFVDIF